MFLCRVQGLGDPAAGFGGGGWRESMEEPRGANHYGEECIQLPQRVEARGQIAMGQPGHVGALKNPSILADRMNIRKFTYRQNRASLAQSDNKQEGRWAKRAAV